MNSALSTRYIQAMNDHDGQALLTCFTPDAVVEDEGHTHTGKAEILAWIEAAFQKYRPQMDVREVKEEAASTLITGEVSGNFDGSPVMLTHHLQVAGDLIARLKITP